MRCCSSARHRGPAHTKKACCKTHMDPSDGVLQRVSPFVCSIFPLTQQLSLPPCSILIASVFSLAVFGTTSCACQVLACMFRCKTKTSLPVACCKLAVPFAVCASAHILLQGEVCISHVYKQQWGQLVT
ncbi:TPA: hypothetical protein ACH3X2_004436 [Trebouxia sp. C0005]